MQRGVYGLSNGGLDAAWPKVQTLKARLRASLATVTTVDALAARLFAALADREMAPDAALPNTGVPAEWERDLSAAFVRSRDQAYGTRCSTLIITERSGRHPVTHVFERSFNTTGDVALLRRATLRSWPPRYRTEGVPMLDSQAAVSESAIDVVVPAGSPVKRTRVRTLLKPEPGRLVRPVALSD